METIDIGSVANDGTGDTLRGAVNKINNNFRESEVNNHRVNLIVDGQFGHWADGPGPFTVSGYSATMWYYTTSGMTSGQIQRQTHIANSTSQYYAQLTGTVSDTVNATDSLRHRVLAKNVQNIYGNTVTVKVRLKGSVAGDVGIRIGGSGLSIVSESVTISTSFTDYTISFPVDSKAQVLDSDYLDVYIDKYLGTTHSYNYTVNPIYQGTLDVDSLSLVEGVDALSRAFLTPAEEHLRIDEYYQEYGDSSDVNAAIPLHVTHNGDNTHVLRSVSFPLRRPLHDPANATLTAGTVDGGTTTGLTLFDTTVRITGNATSASTELSLRNLKIDNRL